MFDALYIGATGMRGQQMQIDAIAQNVANLQSVGYKRSIVSFAEMVATASADGVSSISSNRTVSAGALPMMTLSTAAGELRQTHEALNIAIVGDGFLEVAGAANGTPAYTRAGVLSINADRLLATADGSPLAARIQVPPDARELNIASNGVVSARVGDRDELVELGRIELSVFANPSGLQAIGAGQYIATAQSGEPQTGSPGERGLGEIKQGMLESSNVQMTDEIVSLMLAQRSFELSSKLVQAADQMLGITNGLHR